MSSRPAINSRRGLVGDISSSCRLFQAHVLGEIVVVAAFTCKAPAHRLGGVAAAEHVRQEALLCGPSGFRLCLAVAARHGVVQPAMGGALVDVDIVALLVGFEAIAEALYIGERDDVIGFPEGAEDRAADGGN